MNPAIDISLQTKPARERRAAEDRLKLIRAVHALAKTMNGFVAPGTDNVMATPAILENLERVRIAAATLAAGRSFEEVSAWNS